MKNVKNLAKKLFAIIATLALVLLPMANVHAAAQSITLGPAKQSGKYIAGVTFSYKFTTDGKYLYCVNMHKNTAQNIVADLVTNGSVIDGGIVYILKNGFPEKSITGDTDKDYYITQTAIWWYLDETTGSQNLGEYFKETGSDPYNMRPLVKNLVQEGVKHRNDAHGISESSSFQISTSDTNLTLQNNYYVSKSISAVKPINFNQYTVKLTGAPAGTIIEVADAHTATADATNTVSTTITGDQLFRIKVPASAVTSDLSIKVTATAKGATQYDAYEYRPRDNTMQSVALLEKQTKDYTSVVTLKLTVAAKVSIVKVDANTKQPLAGAVLLLRDGNGKELTKWTSTTKAHVIANLPYGTYTIEEVSAPEGYIKNEKITQFTVSEKNRNIKVQIENAPKKIVVNITKVDQSTGQPLAGAVLVIKDSNGAIIYKFTSTENSEVITDIENGTYTVEELSAPDGYIKSDKIVTFTIDDNHLSHQITFENAKETYVPDTGSVSSMIMIILGIVITGYGLKFVYKNGQRTR